MSHSLNGFLKPVAVSKRENDYTAHMDNLGSLANAGSLSNVSSNSSNSLFSSPSPLEPYYLPNENEQLKPLMDHKKFSLSVKLLDKIIYLKNDNNGSTVTPMRGSIYITIKKPIRISQIQLNLDGHLNTRYFPRTSPPQLNSPSTSIFSTSILSQSRSWQYKANDKVLDTDYFAKGTFTFPFQFLIPNAITESMSNVFGSTTYSLSVTINPFSSNSITKSLHTPSKYSVSLPIQIVQCSAEVIVASTTQSDSVSLGNWRNLLYYKVTVVNRALPIGDKVKVYIKLVPNKARRFKVNKVKIGLSQITEYNVLNRLTEKERMDYYTNLAHTEDVGLKVIEVDDFIDETAVWEFDVPIRKIYPRLNAPPNKEVVLFPTTNAVENNVCHFRVRHKIRIGLVVEGLEDEFDNESVLEFTDNMSAHSMMRTRDPSVDKTIAQIRLEQADNIMIKKNSKLVPELGEKKNKVELKLDADLEILKSESVDGNLPPPSYCDVASERKKLNVASETNKSSYTLTGLKKQSNTCLLNFIVPPAYEEIEEHLEFPPPSYT